MKKKIPSTLSYIIFWVICMTVFAACSNTSNDENDSVILSCYRDSDNPIISTGNLDVSINSYYENNRLNNKLSVKVELVNQQSETVHIQFDDAHIVRESTGTYFNSKQAVEITIGAELKEHVNLNFEIPTSINEENYYLEFFLDKCIIRFYLYNIPEEQLESHVVSYSIDGKIVHEEQVLHGRPIPSYKWFSKDGLYYCIQWTNTDIESFYDDDSNSNLPYTVKTNITVEGEKTDMLQYFTTSSDRYTFAKGLNKDGITPPNKTLVVPNMHEGKPVRFFIYFFDTDLKDIEIVYIPQIDKMYSQFFSKTNLKEIHFAGSEDEWLALDIDLPSRITVHYNSTFVEP